MIFGIFCDGFAVVFDQSGQFFNENNSMIILLNMLIDYSSRTGILFFFTLIGFGIILFYRDKWKFKIKTKNFNEIFILLVFLIASSIILLGLYLSLFLLLKTLSLVEYLKKVRSCSFVGEDYLFMNPSSTWNNQSTKKLIFI